jgi:integrase
MRRGDLPHGATDLIGSRLRVTNSNGGVAPGAEGRVVGITTAGTVVVQFDGGGTVRLTRRAGDRKVSPPVRDEVRPLAPATVEAMRAAVPLRDATLISVLAYAGLRPQEARGSRWGHIGERTIVVNAPKTRTRRNVRLLVPLAADLREWRLASGRPDEDAYVFPGHDGEPWTAEGFNKWRAGRARLPKGPRWGFAKALEGAGIDRARPYDLRHSFASLLLHEGRSVIYVARQLGHGAALTMRVYGHVIEELEDAPRLAAEDAIAAARGKSVPVSYPSAEAV